MTEILIADEGYLYTDGNGVFGKKIYLGKDRNKDEFYLITQEEYEEILKQQEEAIEEDEEMLFI